MEFLVIGAMYHSNYTTSFLPNGIQLKSPFILAYSDIPLFAVDHVTTVLPYSQLPSVYPHIAFDSMTMKRIPVNLLMQGIESVGCYMPQWRRKDFNFMSTERPLSKDSMSDSLSTCDSSRSSTPSSVQTSSSEATPSVENSPKTVKATPHKRHRRNSSINNGHSYNPKHHNLNNQRHHSSTKNWSIDFFSSQIPHHILGDDEWRKLSQGVWKHFMENRQRDETYTQKMKLRETVQGIFRQIFPQCSLHVVGSSVNGLGTNTSDMDMCLMLCNYEIDQQTEALQILRMAQRIFNMCAFVKSTELIVAKVPILKFTDKQYGIQVDFNINNDVGIWNTHLIKSYCQLDWRVQPLVLVIKKWAQDCNINNAKEMTLSSYSLVLMIIHYLQCGCEPPVLPCLQKMYPRRFVPGYHWKWCDFRDSLPHYESKNSDSLGKLLVGFFEYFSNSFNFERDVMSVRLGCKLPKHIAMNFRSPKNKRGHWKYICIEEPFNRTNTACAVYDADSFNRILAAFSTTWTTVKARKEISAILKL